MVKQYSFSEFLKTVYNLILTKMFYPRARLIRRPIYIRGGKSLEFGRGFTTGYNCRFDLQGGAKTLIFGENCKLNDNCHFVAHEKVEIGNNVLFASKIFVSDTSHGAYSGDSQSSPDEAPDVRKLVTKPVKIGNNVWVGDNVAILLGSKIGNGCIVGANSVVCGEFGDNLIIAGVPAKAIKKWNEENKKWERV